MILRQQNKQTLSSTLNQSVYQQLNCLQIPAGQLAEYVQEAFVSNPMLTFDESQPEQNLCDGGDVIRTKPRRFTGGSVSPEYAQWQLETAVCQQSYTDHLLEQLGQIRGLDKNTAALCRYIICSLDSRGYLDCPVSELAEDLGVPLFDMEQALFIVQSLEPVGNGAHDLSECLVLQLAQSRQLNELNLHIAKYGLELLAKNDYTGLARMFHASIAEVQRAAEVIRALNPIPSRGFATGEAMEYVIPEAEISVENGSIVISFNKRTDAHVKLDEYYCSLMNDPNYAEAQDYLKSKLDEAKNFIAGLEFRRSTVGRIIEEIVNLQKDYFIRGAALYPVTMSELGEKLGLSVSTISRGIKDKYILFGASLLPVKNLMSPGVQSAQGESISADRIKMELSRIVQAEDKEKPLSDEMISTALSTLGIELSRRTVSKYRMQANIPPASKRKRVKS